MKLKKILYNTASILNFTASKLSDIEAITSGNPKRIYKRISNKAKNKIIYRVANEVSRKITK